MAPKEPTRFISAAQDRQIVDLLRTYRQGLPIPNPEVGLTDDNSTPLEVVTDVTKVAQMMESFKSQAEQSKVVAISFLGGSDDMFDIVTAKALGGKSYVFHWDLFKKQRGLPIKNRKQYSQRDKDLTYETFCELFDCLLDMFNNEAFIVIAPNATRTMDRVYKGFNQPKPEHSVIRNTFDTSTVVKEAARSEWNLLSPIASSEEKVLNDLNYTTSNLVGYSVGPLKGDESDNCPGRLKQVLFDYQVSALSDYQLCYLSALMHTHLRLLVNMAYLEIKKTIICRWKICSWHHLHYLGKIH